jgi:phosphoglycolate phosphatase-like HAD superfamily hydrolase
MPDSSKPAAVIFDIDGTVADCRHRLHHVHAEPPDWEAFFTGADNDDPLPHGIALALELAVDGHLIWLTGRPERYRKPTVAWLHELGLPTATLHMRADDDQRPAPLFKAERLTQLATQHDITLVVDDDDRVVTALRQAGWPVRHAQWMSL